MASKIKLLKLQTNQFKSYTTENKKGPQSGAFKLSDKTQENSRSNQNQTQPREDSFDQPLAIRLADSALLSV